MLVDTHRRSARRLIWTLLLGLFLGGLLTMLSEAFLPEGAPREFLVTSVTANIGPFAIDLVAVSLTLGPLGITLNVLTLVGIAIVAFIARSLI